MDEQEQHDKQEQPEAGLKCPVCWCADLRVESTRPIGSRVQRRRVCRHCGNKFYTMESAIQKE